MRWQDKIKNFVVNVTWHQKAQNRCGMEKSRKALIQQRTEKVWRR